MAQGPICAQRPITVSREEATYAARKSQSLPLSRLLQAVAPPVLLVGGLQCDDIIAPHVLAYLRQKPIGFPPIQSMGDERQGNLCEPQTDLSRERDTLVHEHSDNHPERGASAAGRHDADVCLDGHGLYPPRGGPAVPHDRPPPRAGLHGIGTGPARSTQNNGLGLNSARYWRNTCSHIENWLITSELNRRFRSDASGMPFSSFSVARVFGARRTRRSFGLPSFAFRHGRPPVRKMWCFLPGKYHHPSWLPMRHKSGNHGGMEPAPPIPTLEPLRWGTPWC